MPLLVPEATAALPAIRREDVCWTGGVGGTPLRLEITFENPGAAPSAPTEAQVEVAAFGAFVPWKPLTRLAVPALPPGGRRVVTAAAGAEADLPPPPIKASSLDPRQALELLSGADHFAGNLNVFVNKGAPVERHLHRAVGLRAGRPNLAMFIVGDGQRDHYTFTLRVGEPGWEFTLLGAAWGVPVEICHTMLMLKVRPPSHAESGRVAVMVRRASTRQEVPVEFELEATPAGARCYFF